MPVEETKTATRTRTRKTATRLKGRPRKTTTRTPKQQAAKQQQVQEQQPAPVQEQQPAPVQEQEQQVQEDLIERKYNNAQQQLSSLERQLEDIEASFTAKAAEIAAASEMISAADYGEVQAYNALERAQEAAKSARYELVISEGTEDLATIQAHVKRCEQHVQACEQAYSEEYQAAEETRVIQKGRVLVLQREQKELQQLRAAVKKHREDMRALATALFQQLGNKQADGVRAYLDDLRAQREAIERQLEQLDATIAIEQRSIGNYLEPWPDLARSVEASHGVRTVTEDATTDIIEAWLDFAEVLRTKGPRAPRHIGNVQLSELLSLPGNIISLLSSPQYWQIRRVKDARGQETDGYTCQAVSVVLSHLHRYRGL